MSVTTSHIGDARKAYRTARRTFVDMESIGHPLTRRSLDAYVTAARMMDAIEGVADQLIVFPEDDLCGPIAERFSDMVTGLQTSLSGPDRRQYLIFLCELCVTLRSHLSGEDVDHSFEQDKKSPEVGTAIVATLGILKGISNVSRAEAMPLLTFIVAHLPAFKHLLKRCPYRPLADIEDCSPQLFPELS